MLLLPGTLELLFFRVYQNFLPINPISQKLKCTYIGCDQMWSKIRCQPTFHFFEGEESKEKYVVVGFRDREGSPRRFVA